MGLDRAIRLLTLRHLNSLTRYCSYSRHRRVLCSHQRRLISICLLLVFSELVPLLASMVQDVLHSDARVSLLDVRSPVLDEYQKR